MFWFCSALYILFSFCMFLSLVGSNHILHVCGDPYSSLVLCCFSLHLTEVLEHHSDPKCVCDLCEARCDKEGLRKTEKINCYYYYYYYNYDSKEMVNKGFPNIEWLLLKGQTIYFLWILQFSPFKKKKSCIPKDKCGKIWDGDYFNLSSRAKVCCSITNKERYWVIGTKGSHLEMQRRCWIKEITVSTPVTTHTFHESQFSIKLNNIIH